MIEALKATAIKKGYIQGNIEMPYEATVRWHIEELTYEYKEYRDCKDDPTAYIFTHKTFKDYKFAIYPHIGFDQIRKLYDNTKRTHIAFDNVNDIIETVMSRIGTDDKSTAFMYIDMCTEMLKIAADTEDIRIIQEEVNNIKNRAGALKWFRQSGWADVPGE